MVSKIPALFFISLINTLHGFPQRLQGYYNSQHGSEEICATIIIQVHPLHKSETIILTTNETLNLENLVKIPDYEHGILTGIILANENNAVKLCTGITHDSITVDCNTFNKSGSIPNLTLSPEVTSLKCTTKPSCNPIPINCAKWYGDPNGNEDNCIFSEYNVQLNEGPENGDEVFPIFEHGRLEIKSGKAVVASFQRGGAIKNCVFNSNATVTKTRYNSFTCTSFDKGKDDPELCNF